MLPALQQHRLSLRADAHSPTLASTLMPFSFQQHNWLCTGPAHRVLAQAGRVGRLGTPAARLLCAACPRARRWQSCCIEAGAQRPRAHIQSLQVQRHQAASSYLHRAPVHFFSWCKHWGTSARGAQKKPLNCVVQFRGRTAIGFCDRLCFFYCHQTAQRAPCESLDALYKSCTKILHEAAAGY